MEQFQGYKIPRTNIRQVERVLQKAQSNVRQACIEEFHRLLAEEVTNLVDRIALNIEERPNCAILDAAADALFEKIRFAESRNLPLEYNFAASVQIIPDRDAVYLILNCQNPNLREAFASTPEIENFVVNLKPSSNGEEDEVQTERSKKWMALQKEYENKPTILFANFGQSLSIDTNLLSTYFMSKPDRATVRARHEMMNRLFNMYACGKEVPPSRVMSVFDQVLTKLLDEQVEEEMHRMEQQLLAILPDITIEMIKPSEPAESVKKEEVTETAENDPSVSE